MLAHKYRPAQFSEVVGQEILTKTLLRCLQDQRIPHALLFHGTRGVGKTTVARIVAKALNCLEKTSVEPCGVCSTCLEITEGRFLDVMEIDAASHTSVEAMREVIEASRYKAVLGQFKVYIIDEVHMLSKSAFNALLKTLEEPPPNVVFILATTELRRVPDTVLSRCMRFDLKRIEGPVLQTHLETVAQCEGVSLEPVAARLLVQAADGSMRDGISLLDQAIALNGTTITASHVRAMLGLINRKALITLLGSLLNGRVEPLDALFTDGADAVALLEGLMEVVYHISCLKTMPQVAKKLLWDAEELSAAQTLCAEVTLPSLMQTWQVLSHGQQEVARSTMPNQALEMILMRLAYLSPLPSAHALLAAIQNPQMETIQKPQPAPVPPEPQQPAAPERSADLENPTARAILKAFPGAKPTFFYSS